MSFTRTLTATVAALYLGMGSAGAEEPEKGYEKFFCLMAKSNPRMRGAKDFYAKHNCQQYESDKSSETSDKTAERPLSCGKDLDYLLMIPISDNDGNHCIRLSKKSTVNTRGTMLKQDLPREVEMWVYERRDRGELGKLTYFRTQGNQLFRVEVGEGLDSTLACDSSNGSEDRKFIYASMGLHTNSFLDLSHREIKRAAEEKFCRYVKRIAAKHKRSKVQKELDSLK